MAQDPGVHLVFGGTGATGRALVRRLVARDARDARVVVAGRDEERTNEAAEELGATAMTFEATDPSSIQDVIEKTVEQFDRLDGIAHCVGSVLLKPAHLTTLEEWRETIELNLTSSFAVLRSGARAMMKKGGSIVFASSAAARIGLANHEAIAAAKGGVQGLVLAGAASYGSKGVRVNAVAPGLVDSPLTERITGNERALETSRAMHVLGRVGAPDEVASAMAWLLDPEQSWITGQILGVDGGLGSVRSAR